MRPHLLMSSILLLGVLAGACREAGRPWATQRTEKVLMQLLTTGDPDMIDVVVSVRLPARYEITPLVISETTNGVTTYVPMTVFKDVSFSRPGGRYVPHLQFMIPPGPSRRVDPPPPLCTTSERASDAVLAPYVYERGQDGSELAVCVSLPRPAWTWSDKDVKRPRLLHIRRRIPVMGHWLECRIDLKGTWPSPRDLGDLIDICRSATIERLAPTPPEARWKLTGRSVESVPPGRLEPR